jgi:hypothetical protein
MTRILPRRSGTSSSTQIRMPVSCSDALIDVEISLTYVSSCHCPHLYGRADGYWCQGVKRLKIEYLIKCDISFWLALLDCHFQRRWLFVSRPRPRGTNIRRIPVAWICRGYCVEGSISTSLFHWLHHIMFCEHCFVVITMPTCHDHDWPA